VARARVRKAGRTIAVVDVDVTHGDDRVLAVGRGCYGTSAG
jgi:acyl-coenzyme A thioesterase PaaI-like protein